VRSSLVVTAIDVIEKFTGAKPGYRRAHARGLVCRGSFTASAAARTVSAAEHFGGGTIAVQVRFSNAAASPFAPDREKPGVGKVLGLAVRFELAAGQMAAWAGVNLPSFVARTPEDFVQLTAAQKPSFFGKPNPLRLLAYVLPRPNVLPAIKAITSMRAAGSFAEVGFNSLHTYIGVDAAGARHPFRYRWVPRVPVGTARVPGPATEHYLLAEMRERLAREPVLWDLQLQLAEPGDKLDDASRAWPATRKLVAAGTLTVSAVEPDQKALEPLVFDPTRVVPGLELSNDPILRFRGEVYGESYRRRSQESRGEPSPPDMGQ
jgi:catalase